MENTRENRSKLIKAGDIETVLCDGVGYIANSEKGETFLEKHGEPHFCCGYHGWLYLLSWDD